MALPDPAAARRGARMRVLTPLRGRVSSFDWLVWIGLIPLSFPPTGPIAAALGAQGTRLAAGVLGGLAMVTFLAVPGVRDPELRLAGRSADAVAAAPAGES